MLVCTVQCIPLYPQAFRHLTFSLLLRQHYECHPYCFHVFTHKKTSNHSRDETLPPFSSFYSLSQSQNNSSNTSGKINGFPAIDFRYTSRKTRIMQVFAALLAFDSSLFRTTFYIIQVVKTWIITVANFRKNTVFYQN